jgi:hypothetical protein
MEEWRAQCLNAHPELLAHVRRKVAEGLSGPQSAAYSPLAWELLSGPAGESPARSGLAALGDALVVQLPLQPLDENVEQALGCTPDQLSPAGASRLKLLRFLRQTQRLAEEPDWSAARFLTDDPAWAEGLGPLEEDDRMIVLGWCLTLVQDVGVTTPAEARGLVDLFHSAGVTSPEAVAEAVGQLLEGRDPVSSVMLAAAFARGGTEDLFPEETAHQIVAALVTDWERSRKRLLAEYLRKRFGRHAPDHAERLQRLAEVLPELTPEAEPAEKTREKPREEGGRKSLVSKWAGFLTGRKGDDEKKQKP